MISFIARCAAASGAAAVSTALFGTGIAVADGLVGKTYTEASAALAQSNKTPVVATVVGDQMTRDDCIVTRSQSKHGSNDVLLYLNCNAEAASANSPGYSAASPEGRAAKKEQANVEWRMTPEGQEWCESAAELWPDWVPAKGCEES
jgi:hypothetical protein